MLVYGVDLCGWPGGLTSMTHGPQELERTIEAFRASLRMLKEERKLLEQERQHIATERRQLRGGKSPKPGADRTSTKPTNPSPETPTT